MKKYFVSIILIVLCGITLLLSGKDTSIEFNPELNMPYHYEAQILLNTSKDKDYPIGYVQMLMKVDYIITFVNSDRDFYLEIEGIKGFLKPSLVRHSSSSSKTKYFNTYDSLQSDKKQIAFKELFLGKKFLISAKAGISMGDGSNDPGLEALREEGILQPLIREFQFMDSSPLSNISMEKAGTFEITDSVVVKGDKYLKMTNRYAVKDFTKDEIQLTSTGQARLKAQDIILAQRMTLNRNTGMPLVAHQYLQLGIESEMFTLVKMKEVDAPDILREYEELNATRLLNAINADRKYADVGKISPFHETPFKSYTTDEHNQRVDQYLDSLTLVEDALNRPMFVYPGIIEVASPPLQGAYVKTGLLRMISEEGGTLSLDAQSGSKNHFSLSHIGPYQSDIFQAQPKVKSCSLDLTVFVATETEEIVLTRKRNNRGKFELDASDSTFTLTYQHDGSRLYMHYPMYSIKCYDKKGNVIQARPVLIDPNGLQKSERYTALEVAEIYANQDLTDLSKTVSYVFEAVHVDRVVLEAYTNEVPFTRTLSRP